MIINNYNPITKLDYPDPDVIRVGVENIYGKGMGRQPYDIAKDVSIFVSW